MMKINNIYIFLFFIFNHHVLFSDFKRIGYFVSSWEKKCGIAMYTNHLVKALREQHKIVNVYNDFFEDSQKFIDDIKKDNIEVLNIQYHSVLIPPIDDFLAILKKVSSENIKIVITLHEEPDDFFRILDIVDHVIIHKPLKNTDYKTNKITYIPMGIPVFPILLSKKDLRDKYSFSSNQTILSTFGFLTPWRKNSDFLFNLIPYLKSNALLHIQILASLPTFGVPEAEKELEKIKNIIKKYKLTPQVTLISDFLPQSEISERLMLSDIGWLWGTRKGNESSAAARDFIAARLPLFLVDWAHYHDISLGIIKSSLKIKPFIDALISVAASKDILNQLKEDMEESYNASNNNVIIGKHINIFNSIINQ